MKNCSFNVVFLSIRDIFVDIVYLFYVIWVYFIFFVNIYYNIGLTTKKYVKNLLKFVKFKKDRGDNIYFLILKIREEVIFCDESYDCVYLGLEEVWKRCVVINK